MQFLDAIGLAYFWEKIKEWANSRFFSKEGGEISPESGLQYTINGEHLGITTRGSKNETINIFDVDENGMEAIAIVKTGGTATQVLMADGSVKTLNASNGIAGLDSNGYVPLSQLGNLDTTVAEVVTALPTTNIKKHIYLIKDTGGVTQNQYEEYIYTGDTSATYDASKWEKLGDFRATVDLADYAKKSEAVNNATASQTPTSIYIKFKNVNYQVLGGFEIFGVTSENAGLMLPSYKNKLDLFDTSKVKNSIDVGLLITAPNGLIGMTFETASIRVDFGLAAGQPISFTLPAASDRAGLMSVADKTKLNGIASGATADSAITTAEIDALFA